MAGDALVVLGRSLYRRADRPVADVPAIRREKKREEEGAARVKQAAVVSSQPGPIRSGPRTAGARAHQGSALVSHAALRQESLFPLVLAIEPQA